MIIMTILKTIIAFLGVAISYLSVRAYSVRKNIDDPYKNKDWYNISIMVGMVAICYIITFVAIMAISQFSPSGPMQSTIYGLILASGAMSWGDVLLYPRSQVMENDFDYLIYDDEGRRRSRQQVMLSENIMVVLIPLFNFAGIYFTYPDPTYLDYIAAISILMAAIWFKVVKSHMRKYFFLDGKVSEENFRNATFWDGKDEISRLKSIVILTIKQLGLLFIWGAILCPLRHYDVLGMIGAISIACLCLDTPLFMNTAYTMKVSCGYEEINIEDVPFLNRVKRLLYYLLHVAILITWIFIMYQTPILHGIFKTL